MGEAVVHAGKMKMSAGQDDILRIISEVVELMVHADRRCLDHLEVQQEEMARLVTKRDKTRALWGQKNTARLQQGENGDDFDDF